MYKELKQGSLVEIYNKYLPFVPRKLEGLSVGIIINVDDCGSYEVDVPGINGHAGTNYGFIKSRWYIPIGTIKGFAKPNNYIEEVE